MNHDSFALPRRTDDTGFQYPISANLIIDVSSSLLFSFIVTLMAQAQRVKVTGWHRINIMMGHGVTVYIQPSMLFGRINMIVHYSNEKSTFTDIITYEFHNSINGFSAVHIVVDGEVLTPEVAADYHERSHAIAALLVMAKSLEAAHERLLDVRETWMENDYIDNPDLSDAIEHAVDPIKYPNIGDWLAEQELSDDEDEE